MKPKTLSILTIATATLLAASAAAHAREEPGSGSGPLDCPSVLEALASDHAEVSDDLLTLCTQPTPSGKGPFGGTGGMGDGRDTAGITHFTSFHSNPPSSHKGPFGGVGGMGDGCDTAGTGHCDRFHPAAGAGAWAKSAPYAARPGTNGD